MMETLQAAAEAVTERWGVHASPDPAVMTVLAAAVVLLTAVPRIWRVVRQAATIVHEMGHVGIALLTGRQVRGIRLHSDTSGVTVTRGRASGPGLLATMLAGYPAPGLLGLGLAALGAAGHSGAALTLYQAVMLLALLLSRNLVGILSCLLAVSATGVIWWINDPQTVAYTVVGLGVFYSLAGVRGTLDVWRVHLTAGRRSRAEAASTDAAQAARAWGALALPAAVWLLVFLLLSLGCAAGVFWLLFL